MRGPHPTLPRFAFLDAARGLGGGGGDDESPRRRHLASTHAVEANPVFPDHEDDPNTNHGDHSDRASAAFPGAIPSRKKKRGENLAPCRCPVCGKRFSQHKALHGHMRCHPDRTWRGITPPVSEKEAAASMATLSSAEGALGQSGTCVPGVAEVSRPGRAWVDTRRVIKTSRVAMQGRWKGGRGVVFMGRGMLGVVVGMREGNR